jgi:hypothetical protein
MVALKKPHRLARATVKGPGPFSAVSRPAVVIAVTKVLKVPALIAVSTISGRNFPSIS